MGMNLIIDTREQKPLVFDNPMFEDIIYKKLDTGDYCIEGMESKLFIERKASIVEFYQNIVQKRFWAELDRAKKFKYKFIVVEFDLETVSAFPYGCGLPPYVIKKLKMNNDFIMRCIVRIMVDYNINFVLATDTKNCVKTVEKICKYVYEKENRF